MAAEHDETYDTFRSLVNMTPAEIERWLKTDESNAVGFKKDEGEESVGHKSGREIVEIKHTKKSDLTDDDYKQMARVVGYIKRHMAQRPDGDVEHTNWRYSLMNWGHDPLKD